MFKIEIMDTVKTKLGLIEPNEEQKKVIALIKTWDPNIIKTALILDDSQSLGVESLYADFFKKYKSPLSYLSEQDNEDETFFPIHCILLNRFHSRSSLNVPSWIVEESDFYSFIYDAWQLIGIEDDTLLNISFDHLGSFGLHSINTDKVEENTLKLLLKLGVSRAELVIDWLPF